MKAYGTLERGIARGLSAFPGVKSVAKAAYQRFCYIRHHEKEFRFALHPQVSLITPAQWAGAAPANGEEFFGYYDKSPWSEDGSSAVFHRILSGGELGIVVYDRNHKASRSIGISKTWSTQQGAMVQWIPGGGARRVIFNTLCDNALSSQTVFVDSGERTVIPFPMQSVHPGGKVGLSLNYRRLNRLSPGYGYSTRACNFRPDQPLHRDGIWRVALSSGEAELIVSLSELVNCAPREEFAGSEHMVNHIMYSPEGTRFVFLHRWVCKGRTSSRLFVADADGRELKILFDERMVSHCCWRDERHLLLWARTRGEGDRYYLIDVETGQRQVVGRDVLDVFGDGHPAYGTHRRWILTDSYPDRARQRHLLLFDRVRGEVVEIGRFFEPWSFYGESRCDLHPRWSPNGKLISIDSAHEGRRGTYILDVSKIVADDRTEH